MKRQMPALMAQIVVSIIYIYIYVLSHYVLHTLANACNVTRISGKIKYNRKRRRLILKFSPDNKASGATFECKLDGGQYTPCEYKYVNVCIYSKSFTIMLWSSHMMPMASLQSAECYCSNWFVPKGGLVTLAMLIV